MKEQARGIENPANPQNTDKKEDFNASSPHRTEIVPNNSFNVKVS